MCENHPVISVLHLASVISVTSMIVMLFSCIELGAWKVVLITRPN